MAAARSLTIGRRLLVGLLLALLALPALQAKLQWVPTRPLGGVTEPAPHPELSWNGLRDNSYQPQLERYLDDRLGFRPWLIRLRNQLQFSLWRRINPEIVLGKEQTLLQQGHVNAYLGRRAQGAAGYERQLRWLRRVQDSLQAHGTHLLVLLAPTKPRIYPEWLPDSCRNAGWQSAAPTNYDVVTREAAKRGLHFLDAAVLLQRWRPAAPCPLFPRTGAHWSGYAVTQVADTLFGRLRATTGRYVPAVRRRGLDWATRTEQLRFTDNDLGELLNLWRDIPPFPQAYPRLEFEASGRRQRPNVLLIGDSFGQSFYGFYPYYEKLLSPESRFWFYDRTVFWPLDTPGESRNVAELPLGEQLRGRDAVVLVVMEENLNNFGFGFIERAFNHFCPRTAQDDARVKELMDQIGNNPEWLNQVQRKAEANHQSLLEAMEADARYLQEQER